MRKPVAEMTPDELLAETEFWQDFFKDCAECGQGISTKETVRSRDVVDEYMKRWRETPSTVCLSRMVDCYA